MGPDDSGEQLLRIVTWNMARKGPETLDFLLKLEPDIALLQEVTPPEATPGYEKPLWTAALPNGQWGSAILSRVGQVERVWEDWSRGAVLLAHCSIPSLGAVSVASIHARVGPDRTGVIRPLRETFEELRSRLGERFILGGDLNTARLLGQAYAEHWGHAEFWSEVDAWAFDCYYRLHGDEKQSFWRKELRNELMDDHILVDGETFGHVTDASVLDTPQVRALSDHAPVVVDLVLPNEAAMNQLGTTESSQSRWIAAKRRTVKAGTLLPSDSDVSIVFKIGALAESDSSSRDLLGAEEGTMKATVAKLAMDSGKG